MVNIQSGAITTFPTSANNESGLTLMNNEQDLAILQALPAGSFWWGRNQRMMKGILKAQSYLWNDWIEVLGASPGLSGYGPNPQVDTGGTGQQFLGFAYGTGAGGSAALAKANLATAQVQVQAAGTGYAVGDPWTAVDGGSPALTGTVASIVAATGAVASITYTAGTYTTAPAAGTAVATTSTGAGTGLTLAIDMESPNGSVVTPAATPILVPGQPFTLISVFRAPAPGGYAGADPGHGILLGNALNHSAVYDGTPNGRLTGLGVGLSNSPGKLCFRINGDAKVLFPSATQDLRGTGWHIGMASLTPSTGVANLYLDTAVIASATESAGTTINSTPGAQQIRIGAAGLLGSPPVFGFSGDLGDQIVIPNTDLMASGQTATRQAILNPLLSIWGNGGSAT